MSSVVMLNVIMLTALAPGLHLVIFTTVSKNIGQNYAKYCLEDWADVSMF
jgi:hypothetical protein